MLCKLEVLWNCVFCNGFVGGARREGRNRSAVPAERLWFSPLAEGIDAAFGLGGHIRWLFAADEVGEVHDSASNMGYSGWW